MAPAYVYAFAVDEKRAAKKPWFIQHQPDEVVVAERFGLSLQLLEGG
jgi:hypothetical protein